MSDTTKPVTASSLNFNHFFAAMNHGAALVYHEIVQVEQFVTNWTMDNPLVKPLLMEGVTMGELFLTAHGVPMPSVELALSAVTAGLKTMAANDATVKSGGT